MTDLIDLALKAAQQQDWTLLTQLLHQQLIDRPLSERPRPSEFSVISEPSSRWSSDPKLSDPWLALAITVLIEGDFQERWDVSKVFPGFGTAVIDPLIDLLQDEDEDPECRWFAARLLGEVRHPAALRSLVELLRHSTDEDLNEVAAGALASLGLPAVEFLVELLSAPETRLLAVQALVKIPAPEVVEPLLSVADDSQPGIRELAIAALGSFPDPRIPPLLVRSLTDPAAAVRRLAIAGLAVRPDLIHQFDLITKLADRLVDIDLGVCQQAALALGRLGDDSAVSCLQRSLQAALTPPFLQVELIRALAWIGSSRCLDTFQSLIQAGLTGRAVPIEVYQELVAFTGRWEEPDLKPRAVQILIQVLESDLGLEHPNLRRAIALSLGQLQQPEALEPLVQLLADQDEGVRWHAIAALKQLDSLAYSHLKNLQTQPHLPENLQQGVANALREWQIELPQ